jgi:hypothetical protein
MRIEQPAAVARALVHGDQIGRGKVALELLEVELEWRGGGLAADLERPLVRGDLGNHRQVIAHEERLVLREVLGKVRQRRFVVRRAPGALDERQLARQGFELALRRRPGRQRREARRSRHGAVRMARGPASSGCKYQSACALQEVASRRHGSSVWMIREPRFFSNPENVN